MQAVFFFQKVLDLLSAALFFSVSDLVNPMLDQRIGFARGSPAFLGRFISVQKLQESVLGYAFYPEMNRFSGFTEISSNSRFGDSVFKQLPREGNL
jgi:hypothetical protein